MDIGDEDGNVVDIRDGGEDAVDRDVLYLDICQCNSKDETTPTKSIAGNTGKA